MFERNCGKESKLLTAHSETERGERGQLRREFNDRNFHNSVPNKIIPQNSNENQGANSKQAKIRQNFTGS